MKKINKNVGVDRIVAMFIALYGAHCWMDLSRRFIAPKYLFRVRSFARICMVAVQLAMACEITFVTLSWYDILKKVIISKEDSQNGKC